MNLSVSKGNKTFVQTEKSWNSLGEVITQAGQNYSLGVFKDNLRNLSNFQYAEAVGLDFDGGLSIERAKEIFKDYQYIIATTRNHRKQKNGKIQDRFRVIIPLSTPITSPESYKATILSLLQAYPQADPACVDASRMWYPSLNVYHRTTSGQVLDPVEYKAPEKKERKRVETKGALSQRTIDFVLNGADGGTWNHRLHLAATDLNEQNYPIEEAFTMLEKATIGFDGTLDETDVKTIESAYSREPKYDPREVDPPTIDPKPLSSLMAEKPKLDWLIDGLFTVGGFSLIVAQPKAGKSTITRQMALSVARGNEFLGRKTKQGSVLYLALEEQEAVLYEQFKKLGATEKDPIRMHVGPLNPGDPIDGVRGAIEVLNPSFVVVDTLLLFADFDPNSYNDVNKTLAELRKVARDTGAHITCIHHQNKREDKGFESILGSSAMLGSVDCGIIINSRGPDRIISTKQRSGLPFIGQKISYDGRTESYKLAKVEEDEF